jgi:hypothetical protein
VEYALNHPWELAFLLAVLLALVLELGRHVGIYLKTLEDPNRKEQMGTIRDGLFVLLSLLLGFTLALAGARFAERRSLLVDEAVSIGTTYLRASTLPKCYGSHSQDLLRQYVDTRFDLDKVGLDAAGFKEASDHFKQIQHELWADAAAVTQSDRSAITAAYINALNETIDLHEKRVAAFENRIPLSIWLLITSISAIAMFTRGVTLRSRFWLTLILVPITIAIVVALIADLDAPSSGLIRLDQRAMQRLQTELRLELAGPSSVPGRRLVKADPNIN